MTLEQSTIHAKFILDDNDKPRVRGAGQYGIELFVKNAPSDAYAVTYRLHPTYYDPVREARERDQPVDKERAFVEEITSYGNFDVLARVRTRSFPVTLQRSLYDALVESHGNSPDPAIKQALDDIRNH